MTNKQETSTAIPPRNSIRKVTGSSSGTAEAARIGTAPLQLAIKDVLKSQKKRLMGTVSGTAGDALPTTAPLQRNLAMDYPLGAKQRPKADSAVRVLIKKEPITWFWF